ncbi:MAG: ubiquinone biosynthesis regulatory protein kinase UbiB [Gammaproteobacteria bacterium]|nr:ubiquinone biosynthesis regulatory protein kinase UbiB [Gammaproteobacteria bacterium]
MIGPTHILRLFHINRVLLRHGLDEIVFATHLFRPIRFLLLFSPWHWFKTEQRSAPRGVRIRKALEELGPIFIKFGQLLSTRRDVLVDDIADELEKLQDRVPPFDAQQAQELIEAALGESVEEAFAEFEKIPLASASIAQVHAATLKNGRQVVVKVLRPDILHVIKRDVALLYIVAGLAERFWSEGPRLRPREIVAEYEKTILDELDLVREAGNANQLRQNFIDSDILYVPEIIWPMTHKKVMVMERIYGVPVSDLKTLQARQIDFKILAERGVETFFTQVFRDNFFHADMHPGNVFVNCDDPQDPKYIAVDFGIVGSLSPDDQRYLAENLLAFFHRDYKRVAQLHVDSGWVPVGTRVDEFEAAIRTVCEPIFERPLKEISFGQLLVRLFQTARRFDMTVQPQLVLLEKTLLNIEGLGRQLYPDLDLWQTAKPFLERWMSEQVGPRAVLNSIKQELPTWGEALPKLPGLLYELLQHAHEDRLKASSQVDELARLRKEMRQANRRSVLAIVGVGLLVSAAVIFGLDGYQPLMLAGAPLVSWALGLAGGVLLVLALSEVRD